MKKGKRLEYVLFAVAIVASMGLLALGIVMGNWPIVLCAVALLAYACWWPDDDEGRKV